MPQNVLSKKFSGFSASAAIPSTCSKIQHGTVWVSFIAKRFFRQSAKKGHKRRSLTPVEEIESASVPGFRSLWKPFAFTILVGGCSFVGAAIWQYETLRIVVQNMRKAGHGHRDQFYSKVGGWRRTVNTYWNKLDPGGKAVAGIIGVNAVVLLMWRIPSMTNFMIKYFSSSPFSGAPCWSMLLSSFSHYSALHFAANMYVLWSFSGAAVNLLGREQFTALYVTAGLVSAFTSYFNKVARRSLVPSLGASGAVIAILGVVCMEHPNAELSLVFIDQLYPHSFTANTGMKALILLDTVGLVLGWRMFDHAAHLGGMLFGIWYITYGRKLIWSKREGLMKWWHDLRGSP